MLNQFTEKQIEIVKTNNLKNAVKLTGLSQSKVSSIRAELKRRGVELIDNRKLNKNMKEEVKMDVDFLKENNATRLKSFVSVITNIDEFCRVGYTKYVEALKKRKEVLEESIIEINHKIQLSNNTIEDAVKYVAMIKDIRIRREKIKSEFVFITENYNDIKNIMNIISGAHKFLEGGKNRKYTVTHLKDVFGETIQDETSPDYKPIEVKQVVNNEVNEELVALRKEKEEMRKQYDKSILSLRKHNLKMSRKERSDKGKPLTVDKLNDGFYNMFKQLSMVKRNKLTALAEKYYAESDEDQSLVETKEFIIRNFLLPKAIMEEKEMELIKKEYWKELA